jgi:hypothetical protein
MLYPLEYDEISNIFNHTSSALNFELFHINNPCNIIQQYSNFIEFDWQAIYIREGILDELS